jgi:hypothetical protein
MRVRGLVCASVFLCVRVYTRPIFEAVTRGSCVCKWDIIAHTRAQATEFIFAVDDLEEELNEPVASDSLAAVEAMVERVSGAMRTKLEALTERVGEQAPPPPPPAPRARLTAALPRAQYNELNAFAAELTEAGVSEAFARYSPVQLYDRHQQVDQKMDAMDASLRDMRAVRGTAAAARADLLCRGCDGGWARARACSWSCRRTGCASASRRLPGT